MDRPVALDLCCGLGGWATGLIAAGWHVIGVDIEDMFAALGEPKPEHFELVLADICELNGADYAHVKLIVGSSPCQDFSYRAMPWSRAKKLHAPFLGMWLFQQQFRIQREVCAAAGEYVPMVVENVRGARPWIGPSRGRFGSYYLWGDLPAFLPKAIGRGNATEATKVPGRTFCFPEGSANPDAVKGRTGEKGWDGTKAPGFRFDGSGRSFQTESVVRHADGVKNPGRSLARGAEKFNDRKANFPVEVAEGIKCGGDWFNAEQPSISRLTSSNSPARKAASAKIARIPFALSEYIGAFYHPDR